MKGNLRVTALEVRYGKAIAVDKVSMHAPSGCVTAVVGPNGAGKSSLILGIYGSIPATGKIELDQQDMAPLCAIDRARASMAIVPQGRQLFPRMTVRENIQMMADLLGLSKDAVESAINRFPILKTRSRQLAGVLSGGEQQMLVVARALMANPQVLLLDEMVTGLAPKIVQSLMETVHGLSRSGTTVLIADPSLIAMRDVVDRGYVMIRGRVVAELDNANDLDEAYKDAMGLIRETVTDKDMK